MFFHNKFILVSFLSLVLFNVLAKGENIIELSAGMEKDTVDVFFSPNDTIQLSFIFDSSIFSSDKPLCFSKKNNIVFLDGNNIYTPKKVIDIKPDSEKKTIEIKMLLDIVKDQAKKTLTFLFPIDKASIDVAVCFTCRKHKIHFFSAEQQQPKGFDPLKIENSRGDSIFKVIINNKTIKEEYDSDSTMSFNHSTNVLRKKMSSFLEQDIREKDIAVVHFWGHGKIDSTNAQKKNFVFPTINGEMEGRKIVDMVIKTAEKGADVLLFVDACYSYSLQEDLNSAYTNQKEKKGKIHFFASAKKDSKKNDDSIFGDSICEAFKEEEITSKTIMKKLYPSKNSDMYSSWPSQVPIIITRKVEVPRKTNKSLQESFGLGINASYKDKGYLSAGLKAGLKLGEKSGPLFEIGYSYSKLPTLYLYNEIHLFNCVSKNSYNQHELFMNAGYYGHLFKHLEFSPQVALAYAFLDDKKANELKRAGSFIITPEVVLSIPVRNIFLVSLGLGYDFMMKKDFNDLRAFRDLDGFKAQIGINCYWHSNERKK